MSVVRHAKGLFSAFGLILFTLSLVACGGGGGKDTKVDPANIVLQSIAIETTATTIDVDSANNTANLSLIATYSDGSSQIKTTDATWQNDTKDIALLHGSVSVTALKAGTATITASYGGKNATINIAVTQTAVPQITAIAINATTTSIDLDSGNTQSTLSVMATYSDGSTKKADTVQWTNQSTTIGKITAGVAGTTVFTGQNVGTATIKATVGSFSKIIEINVTRAIVDTRELKLVTTTDTFYVGNTKKISASLVVNNVASELTSGITWKSDDTNIATVDMTGNVTGKAEGATIIRAHYQDLDATIGVDVKKKPLNAELESISIESTDFVMTTGDNQNFTVKGHYSDGSTKNVTATWRALNPSTVTIDSVGKASALSQGYGYAFLEAESAGKIATAKIELPIDAASCEGSTVKNVTFHYRRTASDYDGWGLHLWGEAISATTATTWDAPRAFEGSDDFGRKTTVAIVNPAKTLNLIIHKANVKDGDTDRTVPCGVSEVWLVQGKNALYTSKPSTVADTVDDKYAVWSTKDTINWATTGNVTLYYSATGALKRNGGSVTGGTAIALQSQNGGYKIPAGDVAKVADILKSQVWVGSSSGQVTGVQIQGVLDNMYKYSGALGTNFVGQNPVISVWAPTAQTVALRLFDDSITNTNTSLPMTYDASTGVWSITGNADWVGKYYLFDVKVYVPLTGKIETNLVTDPYSVSLSMNGERSQITDLNDPALKPADWDSVQKAAITAPEDMTIYELHVREFSNTDSLVNPQFRGKFKAFTEMNSYGMKHMAGLAKAGLTHVHLLPVFDIATINEDANKIKVTPDLSGYAADSEEQQAAVAKIRLYDGFNWGYDPYHYGAPEGSYSTNPDGTTRIVEFREMVQSLNKIGLRVIMDVVYNHTSASGMWYASVLDRIVPGYYHRLNDNGSVQTSSCCDDTASEYRMMEKLMADTLVRWAKYYKVDGFRFDLMGHHTKTNITTTVRNALNQLTMTNDGVDGKGVYLYGEGWDFGGLAAKAHDQAMIQANAAGTGVGTFNDRMRDAIAGGVGGYNFQNQGYITGTYTDAERLRISLAGNLKGYRGDTTGDGYTNDPQENTVYASAHDNFTLWDLLAAKLPTTATAGDRVRVQNLAMDFVVFAQGIPFLDAGIELLRSKSGDRDSYDSGDWFNKLDYSYSSNNFGVGLPPAWRNDAAAWKVWKPLLTNGNMKPAKAQIQWATEHLKEILAVRKDVRLLRLRTRSEIEQRLSFETSPAGTIVIKINDNGAEDLDSKYEEALIIFNARNQDLDSGFNSQAGELHPTQKASGDTVKFATGTGGQYHVPARTTAVFIKRQ